jgi:futalosine hydrolase
VSLGSVFNVYQDQVFSLGAEDNDSFLDLFDLGLADRNKRPYANGIYQWKETGISAIDVVERRSGITVNTVHGNASSVNEALQKFPHYLETMEGAGFMHVCISEGVHFLQLKAVSNYVEPRNRKNWNMELALNNLTNELLTICRNLK